MLKWIHNNKVTNLSVVIICLIVDSIINASFSSLRPFDPKIRVSTKIESAEIKDIKKNKLHTIYTSMIKAEQGIKNFLSLSIYIYVYIYMYIYYAYIHIYMHMYIYIYIYMYIYNTYINIHKF